jgi:hypothetical protein
MTFNVKIVLNFFKFTTFSNFPKTFLGANVSNFIPWLGTFQLNFNFYCKNCSHTNSIDNSSIWVLSENTNVWEKVVNNVG